MREIITSTWTILIIGIPIGLMAVIGLVGDIIELVRKHTNEKNKI